MSQFIHLPITLVFHTKDDTSHRGTDVNNFERYTRLQMPTTPVAHFLGTNVPWVFFQEPLMPSLPPNPLHKTTVLGYALWEQLFGLGHQGSNSYTALFVDSTCQG